MEEEKQPEEQAEQGEKKEGYGYSYSKKPLWMWILIYLIVGGLIYYLVYAFYIQKKGTNPYSSNSNSSNSGSLYNY